MAGKSKRAKYVSKGQRDSISSDLLRAVKRDRAPVERILNQLKHWSKGKRTMVTIANPNKNETNKRFIRVEGNHSAAFGPWKRMEKDQKKMGFND
jgi:hypothetical protein